MKLSRNRLLISVALIVVVVVGVALALNSMNSAAPTPANAGPNRAIVQNITPQQYQADFTSREHLLIDVRTREEFAGGHIAGAVNIPVEEIGSRLSEIPADETVVLYCRSGNRSAQASQILNQNGYSTVYDLGGVIAWTAAGLPLE